MKYYETITSFEAACERRGYDPTQKPIVDHLPKHLQGWITDSYELIVGAEAINTDENGVVWKPNYLDGKPKFQAAFRVDATPEVPSGVGFSGAHYDDWRTHSGAGSRLSFPDLPRLQHFQKHFEKQHMTMQLLIE